ncbi:MAG: hypothetical protein IH897_06495, partial [Planctomycetes bacterium]|nr:hypothetical protein [Planctomycetota bacterium]
DVNLVRRDLGENPATHIWLWGHGRPRTLQPFSSRFGLSGAVIAAVDLIRGIARSLGMELIYVPGATGYLDTDYAGKGAAAASAVDTFDLVIAHIEAPDEAGHLGDAGAKVEAIERIDEHIVGPLLDKLRRYGPGKLAAFEALETRFPQGERLSALLYPRVADLILYQSEAYAAQYLDFVRRIADEEHSRTAGRTALREAVAKWLFKLMAIKDEYEVARLWLQDPAWQQAASAFDGKVKRYVHLHPPLLRKLGLERKIKLGDWFFPLFRLLHAMRRLRGTALDLLNLSRHRRLERSLIGWYRGLIEEVLPALTHENHALAVALAETPDGIRGYEEIKERTLAETRVEVERLLDAYRNRKDLAMAAQAGGD